MKLAELRPGFTNNTELVKRLREGPDGEARYQSAKRRVRSWLADLREADEPDSTVVEAPALERKLTPEQAWNFNEKAMQVLASNAADSNPDLHELTEYEIINHLVNEGSEFGVLEGNQLGTWQGEDVDPTTLLIFKNSKWAQLTKGE